MRHYGGGIGHQRKSHTIEDESIPIEGDAGNNEDDELAPALPVDPLAPEVPRDSDVQAAINAEEPESDDEDDDVHVEELEPIVEIAGKESTQGKGKGKAVEQ